MSPICQSQGFLALNLMPAIRQFDGQYLLIDTFHHPRTEFLVNPHSGIKHIT